VTFSSPAFSQLEPNASSMSLRDLSFGAIGSSISLIAGFSSMISTEYLMEKWGLKNSNSQSYIFYEYLEKIPQALLRGMLKTFAVLYIILLIPILEEWFFRDLIYGWQTENSKEEIRETKIYRVVSNAVIFGVFHLSLLNGWANIPIFVASTISGIVFATLREITRNCWASTIAHSLNNSFVLMMNFFKH